jgi:hypothetical protein
MFRDTTAMRGASRDSIQKDFRDYAPNEELTPKEEYITDQLSRLESRVNATFRRWMKIDVGTGHPNQTSLCSF